MSIRPVDDWKVVLRHGWSVRWIAGAFLFTLADLFFSNTVWVDLPFPRWVFLVLATVSSLGAFAARFLAQKEFKDLINGKA